MKTLFKILRSIITSFLFLILTVGLIIQFTFTCFKLSGNRIPDLIDKSEVLDSVLKNKIPKKSEEYAIKYIEDYINYVFYKRSFPSTQISNTENLSEKEIQEINNTLKTVREEIDLKYETVLKIRNINNILSNGSVYLLINIGLFIVVLVFGIVTTDFKKAIMAFGLSGILAGIISIIIGSITVNNIQNWFSPKLGAFLTSILRDSFMTSYFDLTIIYICTGLVLFLITFLITKLFLKKTT